MDETSRYVTLHPQRAADEVDRRFAARVGRVLDDLATTAEIRGLQEPALPQLLRALRARQYPAMTTTQESTVDPTETDAWWEADEAALARWSRETDGISDPEAIEVLRAELERLLIEDLGRRPSYAASIASSVDEEPEPRRWLMSMVRFYSSMAATSRRASIAG